MLLDPEGVDIDGRRLFPDRLPSRDLKTPKDQSFVGKQSLCADIISPLAYVLARWTYA